ncbi:hypothetical protein J6590_076466 [Homalodisca vitripennis]|nr:hypothetical protein J6590_076466 [Homalodisca vitripennis]
MYGNPEGRRPRGRPKVRWWNQVKADMEKMGASEEDAEDRSRWRSFVGAAKYHLRYKWPWDLVFMSYWKDKEVRDDIDTLLKKLNSTLCVIRRMKCISNIEAAKTAYFALFETHLKYVLWCGVAHPIPT